MNDKIILLKLYTIAYIIIDFEKHTHTSRDKWKVS